MHGSPLFRQRNERTTPSFESNAHVSRRFLLTSNNHACIWIAIVCLRTHLEEIDYSFFDWDHRKLDACLGYRARILRRRCLTTFVAVRSRLNLDDQLRTRVLSISIPIAARAIYPQTWQAHDTLSCCITSSSSTTIPASSSSLRSSSAPCSTSTAYLCVPWDTTPKRKKKRKEKQLLAR
jgi:hypothetical protein